MGIGHTHEGQSSPVAITECTLDHIALQDRLVVGRRTPSWGRGLRQEPLP